MNPFVYSASIGHDSTVCPSGGVPTEAGVNTVLVDATKRVEVR